MFALVVLCLLTLPALSLAGLVNVTVDDAGVDPLTGQMISYSATVTTFTGWKAQPGCGANCSLAPDAKYAYNGTWHDGSVGAYAQFSFTAVYVWCIIPQGIANISFGIDNNSYVGTYMTTTPETGFAYRALVFSKIMPEGPHILTLNSNVNGVVLLDCITYTYDNTSETDFSDPVQFGPFNSSNQTISSSSLTRGDVAGIVIGSVFAGEMRIINLKRTEIRQSRVSDLIILVEGQPEARVMIRLQ
ncbi:hypothetical protein NP233_g1419 [Leucocoprinus birnbaumii]|uniref:Uncharacterized protein n=1 Tax=Leucocoprinus birnbaumii TaxID=56174 RepID=A0AAD5W349_9AGAR|nr:hypothetical protein NP233_g1419 [Leucocoprinus birnbaumii]